jgi:hypothetical protein
MKIEKLTETSSKADELAALAEIAKAAPHGNYLSALFSPRLLAYVKGQVEMDYPPDVMDALHSARATIQRLEGPFIKEVADLKRELGLRDRRVAQLEAELAALGRKSAAFEVAARRNKEELDVALHRFSLLDQAAAPVIRAFWRSGERSRRIARRHAQGATAPRPSLETGRLAAWPLGPKKTP